MPSAFKTSRKLSAAAATLIPTSPGPGARRCSIVMAMLSSTPRFSTSRTRTSPGASSGAQQPRPQFAGHQPRVMAMSRSHRHFALRRSANRAAQGLRVRRIGHRVEVDASAMQFRMLGADRTRQSPRRRLCGIDGVAAGGSLRQPGRDHQLGAAVLRNERLAQVQQRTPAAVSITSRSRLRSAAGGSKDPPLRLSLAMPHRWM